MSGNMNTPNQSLRNQFPHHLRRLSTTPSQRPSTSSGETIEPKSDFLRDALREKKGLIPPRSHSTTPRRSRTGARSQAFQATQDEWMLSAEDEMTIARRVTNRPHRPRRASDIGSTKPSSSMKIRNLGAREADAQIDKLEKEKWDLKHRIVLQQDQNKKLEEELKEVQEELEWTKPFREENKALHDAVEALSKKVASSEEELDVLKAENADLAQRNNERQLAIEEAAGWIQKLEMRIETLEQHMQAPAVSPGPAGSDYFSGDTDNSPPKRTASKPPKTLSTLGPPDSDYFSADTSPNITPRTPKKMQLSAPKAKATQLERARETGASFNRELGLRSAASRDSLFSTFLETPDLSTSQQSRPLPRKTPTPGAWQNKQFNVIIEAGRTDTPPWSDSRPLRSLYEQGELNRQLNCSTPLRMSYSNYTPSVTIASAATSTDDIFSTHSAARAHSPATTVSDTAIPTGRKSSSTIQLPANPSPLNYEAWPRRYPEWPPSAGLKNRDVLFHGDGMEEMFPPSPPDGTGAPITANTSAPRLQLHTRSSSATPTSSGIAPPPPSSSMPSLHRSSTSMSGLLRRPSAPDRRRTLR